MFVYNFLALIPEVVFGPPRIYRSHMALYMHKYGKQVMMSIEIYVQLYNHIARIFAVDRKYRTNLSYAPICRWSRLARSL